MADTIAPTTPGTPSVSSSTSTSVTFTWTPSTDDDGVYAYDIYDNTTLIGTSSTSPSNPASALGPMPVTAHEWAGVAYGNGIFIALYAGNQAQTVTCAVSTDGVNWTQHDTLPSSQFWTGIVFGGGVFVAMAYTSTVAATSTDGITWTQRALPGASASWWSGAYGNGTFVLTKLQSPASNTVAVSTNSGATWVSSSAISLTQGWRAVAYGAGLFVLMGYGFSGSATQYATSPDGVTWTLRNLPVATNILNIVYGNGTFVAAPVSGSPWVLTSTNGTTFTQVAIPASSGYYVGYSSGLYTLVSQTVQSVYTSTDTTTWTLMSPSPFTSAVNYSNFAPTGGNGRIVYMPSTSGTAANSQSLVIYSSPATTYTAAISSGNTYHFNIKARDTSSNVSSASGVLTYPPIPAAPSAPTLSQPTGTNRNVVLSWTSVPGATSYNVYSGTSPGSLSLLGTSGTTTYTDSSLTIDGTYYYTVSAANSTGTSAQSPSTSTKIDRAFTGMSSL